MVGIFGVIIKLMEQHQPEDFYSPVLISYLLTGLVDNLHLFHSLWLDQEQTRVYQTKLEALILKYVEDAATQNIYLGKLQAVSL